VDLSVVLGTLLGLVAFVLAWLVFRRLRLIRSGGVHVALRTRLDESGKGWKLGVGRYRGDEFAWFRVLSLRHGPDRVIRRNGVEIADRREPHGVEAYTVPVDARVVRFRHKNNTDPDVEIAMGPDALTGFLSWLESAPPGRLPWAS
jgi:Protein of unknown function (DUF2550)